MMDQKPKSTYRYFLSGIFLLLICHLTSFAQSGALKTDLLILTSHSDSMINNYPAEKVYLQFDKPYYAVNDTLWFKAYLLNAPSLMFSAKSGLLHVDISDDSGKLVKQYLFKVKNGLGWGNPALDDKNFKTGSYTLHAYTNWMRNFGQDIFFEKRFYIMDADENKWLIISKTNTANNSVRAKIQFNNDDNTFFDDKPLQLQVMSGDRKLYKQKIQTDKDGQIDVNFNLPEKASGITLVAENETNGRKAIIPLIINRPEKTDVQFLPEGGGLIAGLPAHIGFKAIGEDGKGATISGVILDHNQQQVATFQSTHNGMGSFYLNVEPGESYTAHVTLPGTTTKEYALPVVKSSGTILQVKDQPESDSTEVIVAATSDIVKANGSYFLIGKARGIVCYAAIVDFHEINYIRKKIAKRLFPSGIAHFILASAKGQPLNERLVYMDHRDDLNINISSDNPKYDARDSIALKIQVTDNSGKPVMGNFSLAVTDDAQVKTDSLNDENMITQILLKSELKGYIEHPGYYLLSKNKETAQALDNLLLTQGWVNYQLQSVNTPYEAEHGFKVEGNVFNVFNKPVKGTHVLLFSKLPAILMDTVTDKSGKFVFNEFPKIDTAIFVLRAVNKNGKSFNVGIRVDEIKPPFFTNTAIPVLFPWYVNSDTTMLNYAKANALSQFKTDFLTGRHAIKEVKIVAQKTVKGSQNLNGAGNADLVIDEKDLEKAGKKSFMQLLQENVKGFYEGVVFVPPHDIMKVYYMNSKSVHFLVDGVPLWVYADSSSFTRDYLLSHDAQDIKGIEVMSSTKFALSYKSRYFPEADLLKDAFIEITTRSGHGPLIDNTPGMYLYKPLALSWPKQFYKPKYAVTDTTKNLPDLRSTIHWEPNIITDALGKATVWFYAADKSTTYTLISEGIDFNGNIGYKRQKIVINSKSVAAKSK